MQDGSLKRHVISSHSTEIICFDCGYLGKDFVELRNHLKDQHSKATRQFECNKCLYDTDSKFNLKRHFNLKHTLE